jgi:hypothetical protein
METCENCGGSIGKLETPFVWQDRVVCAGCHTKLRQSQTAAETPTLPYATPMQPVSDAVQQYVLTEKTSKRWKRQMLMAAGCTAFGVILTCSGAFSGVYIGSRPGGISGGELGVLMTFGGLVWLLVARIRAWWEHG